MNIDQKLKYKSETGESAYFELESEYLIEAIEGSFFEGMDSSEIIDALNYDYKENRKRGVFVNSFPKNYQKSNDLRIYNPEYVQWLENKIELLEKPKT